MKRIKYNLAALFVIVLIMSSCKKDFFDINVNPNNPADATPALVLPSGLAGSAFVMGGYYQALGGFWTQQYAQAPAASQWTAWESYNLTEDDFDNRQYGTLYSGPLYDFEYVRKSTSTSANWSYYAISTLMQAYTFQVLADLYDKIPFTEALKGVNTIQPHFDNGSLVYDSLLARIDGAMAKDFTVSSSKNPGTADLIFNGDMAKWRQFANTLKLKIYLRYVNVDANKYKTQILALLADNNFLSQDAAFSAFKAQQTGYNPFFNTFMDGLPGNVIANKTMVDFLNATSDPRLNKLFTPSVNGTLYNGLATGESKNHSNQTIKDYATPAVGSISPVYFFTKEETLFLVAEAKARYTTAADAQTTFNAGVSSSLVSLGLSASAISYPYNGIQSIMEQKWIAATNKRGLEAFFDYNRTGYPDFFTKSTTSVLNANDRPKRLFFPASERKTNSNTPAKVALAVKVWWGK